MAITLVASVSATPGATGGATGPITTTGATLLVVSVAWSTPGTLASVTDSNGNTYTALTTRNATAVSHRLWYVVGPSVGAGHTVTVSGTSVFPSVVVYAFAGVSGFQSDNGNAAITVTSLACGTVTPSLNGSLIVTGLGNDAAATVTYPAGFTGGITIPRVASVNMQAAAAYLIQPTAGAINPTWSWTPASRAAGNAAVFSPAPTAVETARPYVVLPC